MELLVSRSGICDFYAESVDYVMFNYSSERILNFFSENKAIPNSFPLPPLSSHSSSPFVIIIKDKLIPPPPNILYTHFN